MASLNQLRMQARRGMLELDVLLTRYINQQATDLSPADMARLSDFLSHDDPVLWDWIFLGVTPPHEFVQIVNHLRGEDPVT